MNIIKMLAAQKELDEKCLAKAQIEGYPVEEITTAYRVELGELLNEWQGFKYWKKSRTISKKDMLIEFADCLHFALSLNNHFPFFTEEHFNEFCNNYDKYLDRMTVYQCIERCFDAGASVLSNTLQLGLKLGFTFDEMERAYWYKYKINLERVSGDY